MFLSGNDINFINVSCWFQGGYLFSLHLPGCTTHVGQRNLVDCRGEVFHPNFCWGVSFPFGNRFIFQREVAAILCVSTHRKMISEMSNT